MTAVPGNTPLTIPDVLPIVAIVVTALLQVPPVTELLKVIVAPAHRSPAPLIVAGNGLTVIDFVATQPVLSV